MTRPTQPEIQGIARELCKQRGENPNDKIGYNSFGGQRQTLYRWMNYEAEAWNRWEEDEALER